MKLTTTTIVKCKEKIKTLLGVMIVTASFSLQAFEVVEFKSTDQKTPLLQLFTSEGCSSCPVADRWFSQLKTHPDLFTGFIPLAFHVDYWDYIGWKDPFAKAEYSERQRNLKKQNLISNIYTPGLVFNEKLWGGWFQGKKRVPNVQENTYVLSIKYDGKVLEVDYSGSNKSQIINTAFFAMDLSSKVKRGENSGKTLHHDFVVLEHQVFEANEQGEYKLDLIKSKQPLGLAVWVSEGSSLISQQAVAGFIDFR